MHVGERLKGLLRMYTAILTMQMQLFDCCVGLVKIVRTWLVPLLCTLVQAFPSGLSRQPSTNRRRTAFAFRLNWFTSKHIQ